MAFPSNAQKFAQPYGVRLSAVPPSSEIVEIEIWAKQHGSTNASTWLGTVGAQQHYAFQHDLPFTTQAWDYKARSVAAGKEASTFTRELVVRPAPLPYIGIGQGAAIDPVLGEKLRVRIQGRAFAPNSHTTLIQYEETRLKLGANTTTFVVCGAAVPLPPRAIIDRYEARLFRQTSGVGLTGAVSVSGNVVDKNGSYVTFGGILSASASTWQTLTDTTLRGTRISTEQTLSLTASIGASTRAVTTPMLGWVDVYYSADEYAAVRGG